MKYFPSNLRHLRELKGLKQGSLYDLLKIKQSTWNNYENGVSVPKLEDFIAISKYFGIDESQMLHENLALSNNLESSKLPDSAKIMRPNLRPNLRPNTKNDAILPESQTVEEPMEPYGFTKGSVAGNIYIIDSKAAAGFPAVVNNTEYLQRLPSFSLPLVGTRLGQHICIEITGDSMHPTIKDREYVIAERVMQVQDIKNGVVAIVVASDGVVCKRIYYDAGKDYLKLVSDNDVYSPYRQPLADVIGIYKSVMKLSYDFRNWQNDVKKEIKEIKERLSALEVRKK